MPWGHPQTELIFEGETEAVDVGIAPLLWELWQALGMCTLNSCQDDDGMVWLHFFSGEPAAAFLNIATALTPDGEAHGYVESLRIRAIGSNRTWDYDAFPVNFAEDDDPPNITMTVSIRFPISEYPDVLSCLQRHNESATTAGATGSG